MPGFHLFQVVGIFLIQPGFLNMTILGLLFEARLDSFSQVIKFSRIQTFASVKGGIHFKIPAVHPGIFLGFFELINFGLDSVGLNKTE